MRVLASEVKARARLGQDVIAEKEAARSKPATTTLGQVVPKYLSARECELREKTYTEARRYLERTWKPLHERPIEAITRADVVGVIDDLERDSGKVAADRARTALSALFAWAIDRLLRRQPNNEYPRAQSKRLAHTCAHGGRARRGVGGLP